MRTPLPFGFAMLLLVACSGAPSGGATRPPPHGAATASTGDPDRGATAASSPTAAECTKLFAHAVALRVAEQRQTLPPAQHPTDAEAAELRAKLEADAGADCRAGSRATYDCAMAATSLAAFEACP